ncbi:MAG: HAMP domain-containing protein [Deltaproteobacteria bacterium]|nr:HAMP domain-containing protein [Deltaproteobacteria bacterium]
MSSSTTSSPARAVRPQAGEEGPLAGEPEDTQRAYPSDGAAWKAEPPTGSGPPRARPQRGPLARLATHFRLRGRLAFLTAAATTAVLAGGAYFTLRLFRGQLLMFAAEASSSHSDTLRVVLEEQMVTGDLKPLRRVVTDLGREPHIAWVGVLANDGRVKISSDPAAVGQRIERDSPDCAICHERPAADRHRSVTLLRPGGAVLRTVTPILNRPACHRCHGEEQRINGILVVDRSLDPIQRAVLSSRAQVITGSAAAVLALLGTLGLAVEGLVLTRLRRLGAAARALGRGDLSARAPDRGTDELGDLGQDFNAMADGLEAALERLSAERRQLEELVNGIGDGVVLVDRSLRVMTMNRAFAERLPPGLPHGPGRPHAELSRAAGYAGPDGASSVAARALGSDALEKEIVRVAAAGGERVEEIYAQPLRGPDGVTVAAIEVWRDITDRLALEAGLEQSERLAAIGVLASSVAHEVGNPLAAIATAVEGLLRRMGPPQPCDPAEVREYLEIVQKQVFRCRDVTERLLGFGRVPSRQLGPVDAAAAAREVLALVAPQARAQQVEVRADLGGEALALGEPLLLQQVFLNLVLNALQAMPGGGRLEVSATASAAAVEVAVADTGPGLPEAVRRRLGEPFLRGRPDGGGTGLGLFLSQALVRRCEGTLAAASVPGRGTTFTVRLRPAGQA